MTKEEKKIKKSEKRAKLMPAWIRALMLLVALALLVLSIVLAVLIMNRSSVANLNSPDFTTADTSSFMGLYVVCIILVIVEAVLLVGHFVLPKVVFKKKIAIGNVILAFIFTCGCLYGMIAGSSATLDGAYQTVAGGSGGSYESFLSSAVSRAYSNDDVTKAEYLKNFIDEYATKQTGGTVKFVRYQVNTFKSDDSNYAYKKSFDKHPHEAYVEYYEGGASKSCTIYDFYIPDGNLDDLKKANSMSTYTAPTSKDTNQELFVTYGGSKKYSNVEGICVYGDITPSFSAYGEINIKDTKGNQELYCTYLIDTKNSAIRLIVYP